MKLAQISSRKPELAAQMIIDSILFQENPTDLKHALKLSTEMTKKHPDFNKTLAEACCSTANFYVYGALIENLPWKKLESLGYLFGSIADGSETSDLLESFLNQVNIRLHFDSEEVGCPKYALLYLHVAEQFPQVLKDHQLELLDQHFIQMRVSCEEYKTNFSKVFELFNKLLQIQMPCDKITPSFRSLVQAILDGNESGGVYLTLDISEKVEFGKFFLENAISRPYLRGRRFALEIEILCEFESETKSEHQGHLVAAEVIKSVKSIFENFEEIKSARRAIGITRFMCDLFKTNQKIISHRKIIEYSKKMKDIALKKRTKCNTICFLNFCAALRTDVYFNAKVFTPKIRSTVGEMICRFDLLERELTDDTIDDIERENELAELKTMK